MKLDKDEAQNLAKSVWDDVLTQVQVPGIMSLYYLAEDIKEKEIYGDVVEVGVWEGGCVIFLSKVFEDTEKKIWAVDSYEGFQNESEASYEYVGERHTPEIHKKLENSVFIRNAPSLQVSLERVKKNLTKYGVGENTNVNFLKGFANEVLIPSVCPIQNISLLRIDVDSYSATREVLDFLYDRVTSGGYIVFDDWGIPEAENAIVDFFASKGINNIEEKLTFPHKKRYPYLKKGLL